MEVYIKSSRIHRELEVYQHIKILSLDYNGRYYIRILLDSFEVDGPNGRHVCLVYELLGISFNELRTLTAEQMFDEDLIRQTFRHILTGLEFLYNEAHVIHTVKEIKI